MAKKPSKKLTKTDKVLVLRTCAPDMSSYHTKSFVWPKEGYVEAPDWNPDPKLECGQGLHGLLWGNGDWSLLSSEPDAVWMLVSVDPADGLVVGENKCRFRRGEVVYCGDMAGATTRILCSPEVFARNAAEAGGNSSSGECSTAASSGYGSTAASSGECSTAASSGECSTAASSGYDSKAASSGNYSKAASSGECSTAASSGECSTAASSGYGSTAASSGECSTAASSGECSTAASSGYDSTAASSGDRSKAASSGDRSTAASSGDYSTAASSGKSGIAATIGNGGYAKAGENGLIIVTYWDEKAERYDACIGKVGIGGIKADTFYRVVNGKLKAV